MAQRYWTPTRSYDFQLIIKDKDYTPDLQRVVILTSLTTPYQTFLIDMFIDANDMILDKIYGQDKLKLNIRLFGQGSVPIEEINIELLLLDVRYDIEMKSVDPKTTMKDRSAIELITVCRKPFKTMTTVVNSLSNAATPSSVISSLVESIPGSPTLDIDQNDLNTEKIDQILVPPVPFMKAVKYLNVQFGIYNRGYMGFVCLHDNTIYVKNLSKKIKASHTFTIHHLTTDAKEAEKIIQGADGKTFYTWNAVETLYKGNTTYAFLAPRNRYITKPKDLLYRNIDINAHTSAKDYGLVSRDTNIFYDSGAISDRRRIVHSDHTGYEESESFIRFPDLAEVATLMVEMTSKNITIINLMHVGDTAKFTSKVVDYTAISGKYILKSSELTFERVREWEATARINLIRTNRVII